MILVMVIVSQVKQTRGGDTGGKRSTQQHKKSTASPQRYGSGNAERGP